MSVSTEPVAPQPRPRQSSLSSYPDYSPSDSRWLPELPRGWSTNRLKFLATINSSNVDKRSEEDEESVRLCNYTDVYYEDEITEDLDFMEATASLEEIQDYSLQENDVIVTKDSESWDDIAVPAFVPRSLERVLCGYHLAIIRPIKGRASGRFLSYAFQAGNIAAQLRVEASGITRYGLTVRSLQDAQFPVPPIRQQTLIADFLDQKTSKIDRLIDKKQRLIKLLEERRTALITKAVTKGLDPDVPMKECRIRWIENIPKHWTSRALLTEYEVQLGKMLDEKEITGDSLAPYLRNADVQWDSINMTDLPQMDFSPRDRLKYRLEPGDLLVCEGGEIGRTAIWRGQLEECYYQKALHRLRPLKKDCACPRFMYYLMRAATAIGAFEAESNKNTIDHLTAVQLRHHNFPFPPSKEQKEIADFLDDEIEQTKRTLGICKEAIKYLREYRSALITAAVTGEIDVRDHAA